MIMIIRAENPLGFHGQTAKPPWSKRMLVISPLLRRNALNQLGNWIPSLVFSF